MCEFHGYCYLPQLLVTYLFLSFDEADVSHVYPTPISFKAFVLVSRLYIFLFFSFFWCSLLGGSWDESSKDACLLFISHFYVIYNFINILAFCILTSKCFFL